MNKEFNKVLELIKKLRVENVDMMTKYNEFCDFFDQVQQENKVFFKQANVYQAKLILLSNKHDILTKKLKNKKFIMKMMRNKIKRLKKKKSKKEYRKNESESFTFFYRHST